MSESFDVLMVGPVARDEVVVGTTTETLTGGGVWYGAYPLRALGLSVAIVTRLARADFPHLEPLQEAGVTLYAREAFATTGIRNVYEPSMEERRCSVLGCAAAILPEDLPRVTARAVYAAPLMRGELPPETVRDLSRLAPLSVDLQGYLRYRQGTELPTGPYDDLDDVLAATRWLKADLAEGAMATGCRKPEAMARGLAERGPREVLITGGGQVLVYAEGELHRASLEAPSQAGRTGRGDTCMATYVGARLMGRPVPLALEWAAAVTRLKVAAPGPYRGAVPPAS